jgi:hypothetical protein
MSDPQSQRPPESSNAPDAPRAAAAGGNGQVDPLEQLHKMSRTAGLGATDYVAVNAVSVAALFLGLGSSLALLDRILLVIPLAAIACAIVALYQVSKSSGTQTGRGLAWFGLLLALAFTGAQVTRQVVHGVRTRADRQAIAELVRQFGQKLNAQDLQAAYTMMSGRFRERVPLDEFNGSLTLRLRHPSYGQVNNLRSNEIIQFDTDETGLNRTAGSNIIVELARHGSEPERMPATFLKSGERWYLDDLPNWFPAQRGQ